MPTLWNVSLNLQHEAALNKAEANLEEDAANFDKFLKQSDEKVQQAMGKADTEMKAKQEKVMSKMSPALIGLPLPHSSQETCHLCGHTVSNFSQGKAQSNPYGVGS